jgi:CubicO group peptidase (beta-lactamase class C family)
MEPEVRRAQIWDWAELLVVGGRRWGRRAVVAAVAPIAALGGVFVRAAFCESPARAAALESQRAGLRRLARLSQDDRRTREQVLERMSQLKVPGLGIALVKDFKVEWARGYGVERAGGSQPVTAQTRFQAASISKPVTALAALRLVQQGKLDLDEALNQKLVSWKVPDNEFTQRKQPNLRLVLAHGGGFSVHGFPGYPAGRNLPTLLQILDGSKPANSAPIRVQYVPGSRGQYSGGGYTVIQQLMIDVTKLPFPQAMRELVLDPLGMKDSTFVQPPPDGFESVAAIAHVNGTPLSSLWHVYPEMAAAGLWTTPSDLARFVIALQRARRGDADSILSPRLIGEMLRRQINDVGLGVALRGTGKSAAFLHGGSNAGFRCHLIGFAQTGQGAVLMTNADTGQALIDELVKCLRAEYGWPG